MYVFERARTEAEANSGLWHRASITAESDAPLLLLVHGRAGNFEVMSAFKGCLPPNLNVLIPQAPIAELHGFSWWLKEGEDWRVGSDRAYELLQSFIELAIDNYRLRPRALLALGFSQGAALLSLFAQRASVSFSSIGLLAGFVFEDAAQAPVPLPHIFMAHGSNDQTIPVSLALQGKDFLVERGFEVEFHQDPVGHKVGSQGMRALREWLAREAARERP